MRNNIQSLKKLLELTQKQVDDSARNLGQLNVQCLEAKKKLNLLLHYRNNYQLRLQDSSQNGIEHIKWQNYHMFIDKLEHAISEQQQTVQNAESNRSAGNEELQSRQRKLNAYDTLFQRYQKTENQRQNRIEQKELDEFASNRFIRDNPNNQK